MGLGGCRDQSPDRRPSRHTLKAGIAEFAHMSRNITCSVQSGAFGLTWLLVASVGALAAQEPCAPIGDAWCSEYEIQDGLLRLARATSTVIGRDGCLATGDVICGE